MARSVKFLRGRFGARLCENAEKIGTKKNRALSTVAMGFSRHRDGHHTHENFVFLRFQYSLGRKQPLARDGIVSAVQKRQSSPMSRVHTSAKRQRGANHDVVSRLVAQTTRVRYPRLLC